MRGRRGGVGSTLFVRPPENVAALDGLRAIAVLLVLVYHCGLWSGALVFAPPGPIRRLLDGCRMGVDVFFVLSGFLIGRTLVDGLMHEGRLPGRSRRECSSASSGQCSKRAPPSRAGSTIGVPERRGPIAPAGRGAATPQGLRST